MASHSYVTRSRAILALEYKYFMHLRVAGFLGFPLNRDFVWVVGEAEPCENHERLRKRARRAFRCGRDSHETKEEMAGSWQEAVAPPLNPIFAGEIQDMEEKVLTNWKSICAKLGDSNSEEHINKKDEEEDYEDKINKTLIQVGALSLEAP
jgi:hypothetical protein